MPEKFKKLFILIHLSFFIFTDANEDCFFTKPSQDVFAISGENVTVELQTKINVTKYPDASLQFLQPADRLLYYVEIKQNNAVPQGVIKSKPFSNRITWSGDPTRNSASFVFSKVTRDLSLKYFVNLFCGIKQIEGNVVLHVLEPPTFLQNKSLVERSIREGNIFSENCSIVWELPMLIKWFKNGVKLTEGSNSSKLTIPNTNRSDEGTYSCVAESSITTITRWINVTVLYGATITNLSSSSKISFVGQIVTFHCTFDGNPTPTYQWITPNPRGNNSYSVKDGSSILHVKFQNSSDFGNFTCVVNNSINNVNRTIAVTEMFAPGKVIILHNHTGVHEISLNWSSPNNGGSLISGYIITVTGGEVFNTQKNITSYEIKHLLKNTSYEFCIQARNEVGKSKESCINLTTLYEGPPGRPTKPRAKYVWRNEKGFVIKVSWKSVNEAKYYIVLYRQQGKQEWNVNDRPTLTFEFDGKTGTTYEIQIKAGNKHGVSLPSSVQTVTIPPRTTASRRPPTGTNTTREVMPPAKKTSGDMNVVIIIIISVLLFLLIIIASGFIVLWMKRRSGREEQSSDANDHISGPLHGDIYAMAAVKPKKKQKNPNDLVYAELSDLTPVGDEGKPDLYEPTDYADISHILTPQADLLYSNVEPPCSVEGAYANVDEILTK